MAVLCFIWTHKLNYMEHMYESYRILVTREWLLPFLLIPVATAVFLRITRRVSLRKQVTNMK